MARDDTGREGGGRGRRRRKRRGRGGRGGEDRGQAPFPQQHAAEPQPFEHGDGGPERPSEFAPGGNGDFAPGEHAPIEARSQPDHGDNGDGEPPPPSAWAARRPPQPPRSRGPGNFDFAGASGPGIHAVRIPQCRAGYDRPLHDDASPWTERARATRRRLRAPCAGCRARAAAQRTAACRGAARATAGARRAATPPLDRARARADVQRHRARGDADAGAATCVAPEPAVTTPEPERRKQAAPHRLVGEASARWRQRTGLMQSRWVDRDAKAAVDRYRGAGRCARAGAARLHDAPARRRSQSWSCTAAAIHRSRRACAISRATRSTCCASRAPAATWRRSSLPACRRCGSTSLRKLRALDELSDEDMVRVQRANLLDPTAPSPSVETAAARLRAARTLSITPTPMRC